MIKKLIDSGEFVLETPDFGREIKGVYCCDLLSVVMGRAKADFAWVTVMGNVNSIAVAVLTDVACIVIAENVPLDASAKIRAEEKKVTVLRTKLPIFEAGLIIRELVGQCTD